MAKDPAFLFYPNDYIGGTMGMTFEEKGAYMELLMMQFNRGHMTTHMIGQTVGQLWDTIQVKFIQDTNGLWFNKRLEEEQIKRQNFTESRRNNVKGENQYTKKPIKKRGHMTTHMEDVNEDENINRDESKNKIVIPFDGDEFIQVWEFWKKFKKEQFAFTYKPIGEQGALSSLYEKSGGKVETAMLIIKQSIQNGWKGFFELKGAAKSEEYDREEVYRLLNQK